MSSIPCCFITHSPNGALCWWDLLLKFLFLVFGLLELIPLVFRHFGYSKGGFWKTPAPCLFHSNCDVASWDEVTGRGESCRDIEAYIVLSLDWRVNEASWPLGRCFPDDRLPSVSNKPLFSILKEREKDKTSSRDRTQLHIKYQHKRAQGEDMNRRVIVREEDCLKLKIKIEKRN